MARISYNKLRDYTRAKGSVAKVSKDELKEMAYDTLFEVSSAWCVSFGVNLRDAVYCEWWDTARKMLDGKSGRAKEIALVVIADLESMSKED